MQSTHLLPQGLTASEVLAQRRQYGENVLPTAKRISAVGIFINQFKNLEFR